MLAISLAAAGAYASGEIGDDGAQSTEVLWSSRVFGIEQGLDQRGTDDHQIGEIGHFPSLLAIGYPEADADHGGWVHIAHPSHKLRGGR
jgi:hypothetical protein